MRFKDQEPDSSPLSPKRRFIEVIDITGDEPVIIVKTILRFITLTRTGCSELKMMTYHLRQKSLISQEMMMMRLQEHQHHHNHRKRVHYIRIL